MCSPSASRAFLLGEGDQKGEGSPFNRGCVLSSRRLFKRMGLWDSLEWIICWVSGQSKHSRERIWKDSQKKNEAKAHGRCPALSSKELRWASILLLR